MVSGPVPAEELPSDIRSLAERLAARLAERLGDDMVKGPLRLELQYVNGALRWLTPSPKIPASAFDIRRSS